MITLTITPEFSTDELQDLIDGLPPYWTTYHHDEYISQQIINYKNLILIDIDGTPDEIYGTKSYINWIDGSYWTYTHCCEYPDGPYPYGPETPPIHTCETPLGFDEGWNEAPSIPDDPDQDIPW